jgi:AcrR family transcriptional regulator
LSVEGIVGAAIEVADADGLGALSMRRVAGRFGVNAMALYTYVPGKAELVDLMLDRVIGEAARPDGVGGWRAGLELYAREAWALYHRHPWVLRVPYSRGLMGPNQAAALDSALRTLSGIGLSDAEMVAVFGVVSGYVQGAARTSAEAAQNARATGLTDDEWWTTQGSLMAEYIDRDHYPTLAGIPAEAWVFEESENGGFEFGLRRVLDGIEAFVRTRSAPPDRTPPRQQ